MLPVKPVRASVCLLTVLMLASVPVIAAGDPEQLYQQAIRQLNSDDRLQEQAAVSWLRRSAHAGHAGARYELGRAYGNALGVPRDYELAVFWYRRAAHQGFVKAQHLMCLSHATGRGALSDAVMAWAWCDIAADSGHQESIQARDAIAPNLDDEARQQALEWKHFLQQKIADTSIQFQQGEP